jgi:hypothetical protein
MAVISRTWPFGTVKEVEILDVLEAGNIMTIVARETADEREGFVLVYRRGTVSASIGDRGTITFSEGGPTGGYWALTPFGRMA